MRTPSFPRLGRQSARWSRALRSVFCYPTVRDRTERNIWYLCVEVAWAAVLSAAAAFNATFALRLGASNAMIGWLTSAPCLIAVALLIPSARFLETKSDRAPWVTGSLLVARLGYGLLALLPWLLHRHLADAVVWLLVAIAVPTTFFSAGWTPLLADVIPERDRTRVIAMRNILVSTTVAALTFVAGRWLEASQRLPWATFPANYQVVYMVGFAGALVSTYYVRQLRLPANVVVDRGRHGVPRKPFWAELKTMLTVDRSFAAIVVNTLIYDSGAWLVGPLYVILFVRHLGASDGWIGLNGTLANLGVIAGYALWRRGVRKLGNARALRLSAPMGACYAFLVALFPNLTLILAWGVLINLINPGITLSHFNILLQTCPSDRRASYIATFSTIMNAAAFALPLLGVALAGPLGIRTVLLIGGTIRLLGSILFHVNPVQVQEKAQ